MDMEHTQEQKMAEEELSQVSTAKKIRQTISVPFVWEITPGTPKKDWKPTLPTRPRVPPVKLIASVPFGWEEKPGKPLPHCSQPPPSSPLSIGQAGNNSSQSPLQFIASVPSKWGEKPSKPLPCSSQPPPASPPVNSFPSPVKLIASVPFEWEETPGKPLPFMQSPSRSALALPQAESNSSSSSPGGNKDNQISMNYQDSNDHEMLESDPETCKYETDDGSSFTSAPSVSANNLRQTVAAVPLRQSPLKDLNSGPLQSPGSPASETESKCSYATGTTSLVGASFLQWLFPLLTPHSHFLEKDGCSESAPQIQSKQSTDFHQERNYNAAIRRPPTLGELIMMSRRRSYQRKAIQMQKQNLSKEIMKTNAMGCGIFGTSNILGRFDMKLRKQLQLKFM